MNFISRLIVGGAGSHHVEEFREFNLSTAIRIELSDHLIHSLCFRLNTERVNGHFEF